MDTLFFYGSLCHRPLLDLVLGPQHGAQIIPAKLQDHAVYWVENQAFPQITRQSESVAEGVFVTGLTPLNVARLDFYEGGFDYALLPVSVDTGDGARPAKVYFTDEGRWPVGAPWSLADWERDWAAISLRAASEAMAFFGKISATELARHLPQIRARAASWVRAEATGAPMILRRGMAGADIQIHATRQPYLKYFALEEHDLRFRRFDGRMSPMVTRAAFVSGDAVTVLPYDPVRDRVLVIEQFRVGPLARGDRHPWSIEPIAGRVDPGETPEACARREAMEETGLHLLRLEPIASYYPSPGAVTEYLYSYVAIADLPDGTAGIGGEDAEAEDIRSLVMSFDELQAFMASGEAENGPLILSALWLAAHRSRLRGEA